MMYRITDLTRDNTEFFADFIGEDMAENIGRINYRGFVLTNGDSEPVAGMIWRITKPGAASDIESVVEWIRVDREDAFNEMLASYKEWIDEDEAVGSKVVIPAKEGRVIKNLHTDIYTLRHVPGRITMGSEYNSYFNNRLSDKERASKKKNKRSRLWQKEENAKLLEASTEEYKTASFDALNRAMTKQALRADAKEYNDLAAFMDHKDDVKNIELVNL